MSKTVYTGLESSGKSLRMAMRAREIRERNAKWRKKYGILRPILSNGHFSKEFEAKAKEQEVPIQYWSDLEEIVGAEECDLFIEEIGTYFDSRLWGDLSLDCRRWIAQTDKRGVDFYATAQDFAQVDLSFRRLVSDLYYIQKLAGSSRPARSKPPVGQIWGVCWEMELNARNYSETEKEVVSYFGGFFIEKWACDIFDTHEKMVKSAAPPLEHIERTCPDCGKVHLTHR